jgi:hypothetical protein
MKNPVKINSLSKDYILDNIDQALIFSHYLNIPINTIIKSIQFNQLIHSPFRKDPKPSFLFSYNKQGKLIGHDFGRNDIHIDCFDAVAIKLNYIRPISTSNFIDVLKHIYNDLLIAHHEVYLPTQINAHITAESALLSLGELTAIEKVYTYQLRNWSKDDIRFWKQYYISLNILEKFNVAPLFSFHINDTCIYRYKYTNAAYIYIFNDSAFQVYLPHSPYNKNRFIINRPIIMNGANLVNGKHCIITKSYKDIMFLYNYRSLDIQAIAPHSESTILTPDQINYVKSKCDNIYTLSDFDYTGVKFANTMRKKYGTIPYFLTNGRFGTINFRHKDPTDFVKSQSKVIFDKLINTIISYGVNSDEFITICNNIGLNKYASDDLPY